MVGFSRLYCSILETTAGVATFGFDPPIRPGGRNVPVIRKSNEREKRNKYDQSVGLNYVRIFDEVQAFGFIFYLL